MTLFIKVINSSFQGLIHLGLTSVGTFILHASPAKNYFEENLRYYFILNILVHIS